MNRKPPGRPKGTPNKLTASVKQTFTDVFTAIQEIDEKDPRSKAKLWFWALDNPKEFYQLAAKLIPTEINATVEKQYVMRTPSPVETAEAWAEQHPEVTIQ